MNNSTIFNQIWKILLDLHYVVLSFSDIKLEEHNRKRMSYSYEIEKTNWKRDTTKSGQ
jgi:hypothetical protein